MNQQDFKNDYDFAVESGEFAGLCPSLRYVASINLEATQKDFVAGAKAVGINTDTAAIQFRQSRRESIELGILQ